MSVRSAITSEITSRLFSESAERRRREAAERRRRKARAPHVVEYFHQADDPYAHLTAQVLSDLIRRYDIELKPWLCSPPQDAAAPDRQRLIDYSRIDAARLAKRAGLSFEDPGAQPDREQVTLAEAALASSMDRGAFTLEAQAIGGALWSGGAFPANASIEGARTRLHEGDARRAKLGHYLGATFYYGREWYWGLDRLHYLESRLAELGAQRATAGASPIFPPPTALTANGVAPARGPVLDFFLSFRSPYTYIVTERIQALATSYGAELRLRFVLPLVMRGMQVPAAKRMYISTDAAREARRAGVPFGRIADPVGRPVERGYSLLPWATSQGKGYAYCLAFMRAVWSQGVDAGEAEGLRRIVEQAGLEWNVARKLVGNDDWRSEAEANRQEMLSLGLWGVPSFRLGNLAVWGQDRLWTLEDEMRGHMRRQA